MTTEDLQERYRDRSREIKPAHVPLAADAAHLLSDYLDMVCIELMKRGITEPYRITREFEEIFAQELQQLGTKHKLTYDATSRMLERYGTPRSVVEKYITEQQPTTHAYLQEQVVMENTGEKNEVSEDTGHLWKGIIALVLIAMILAEAEYIINQSFPSHHIQLVFLPSLPTLAIVFVIIELITGLAGDTGISPQHYQNLRETIRFLFSFLVLEHLLLSSSMTPNMILWFRYGNQGMFVIWALIYGIGLIKDRTNLLQSTGQPKPVIRFILPSYLLLAFSYGLALVFLRAVDTHEIETIYFSTVTSLLLVGSATSMAMDIPRKYPLSYKKIGYTMVFLVLPHLTFDGRFYDWVGRIFIILWVIVYGIIVRKLFAEKRHLFWGKVRGQLRAYQNHVQRNLQQYSKEM